MREAQARARERSLQVQRQRDLISQQRALRGLKPIPKPQPPLPPTPEQIKAEEYKKEYTKTISTLETERSNYSKQLDELKKEKAELIARLDREGKLDSDVLKGISKDYIEKKIPLESRVSALSETIHLAKEKGIANLSQLRTYAMRSADVQTQQKKSQIKFQERKLIEKKELEAWEEIKKKYPLASERAISIEGVYRPGYKQYAPGGRFAPGTGIPFTPKTIDVPTEFRDAVQETDSPFTGIGTQDFTSATEDIGRSGFVSAQDLKKKEDLVDYDADGISRGDIRDDKGFLGSLWSGVTDFIGSGSDFQKRDKDYFEKTTGAPILNISGMGGFNVVSSQPIGAGGTALLTPIISPKDITPTKPSEKPSSVISIDTGKPSETYIPISFGDVTQSFENIFGVKTIGRESFGAYVSDIFQPFEGKGKPKYLKEIEIYEPQFGTKAGDIYDPYKTITYGDLQTKQELEAGLPIGITRIPEEAIVQRIADKITNKFEAQAQTIILNLQKKINKREITLEEAEAEAQKQLTQIQKELNDEYQNNARNILDKVDKQKIKNLGMTTGDLIKRHTPSILGLSVYALAFTNPFTGTIASAVLTGTAIKPISTGFLGEDLALKSRIGLIAGGGLQAGFGFWGAGSIFGQSTGRSMLSRQAQKLALKDLEAQPLLFTGKELYRGKKGSLFEYFATRTGKEAVQEIKILTPTFEKGFGRIVGAKAISKIRLYDPISGKLFKGVDEFVLGARVSRLGEGVRIKTAPFMTLGKDGKIIISQELKELQSAIGSGFLRKRGAETFKEFRLQQIQQLKQDENLIKVLGLDPSKILLGMKDIKVRGKPISVGEVKLLKQQTDEFSNLILGKGKKTPFAKTFAEEFGEQVLVSDIKPLFAEGITKKVVTEGIKEAKQLTKTGLKAIQRGVGISALSQTDEQLDKLSSTLGSSQLSKLQEEQLERLSSSMFAPVKLEDISTTKVDERVKISSAQIPVEKLITDQELKLRQVQIPAFDFPITPIPEIPYPKIPFKFSIPSKKERKILFKVKEEPHELLIKSKGKWRSVGEPFPSKQRALDVGAFFTDTSLPAHFKVIKSKRKPAKEQQFSVPTGYFTREALGKFRSYRIRKGKRIPLKDSFIELRGKRLDTRGEVQKIHLAKALADNRRRLMQQQQINRNLNKMFFPTIVRKQPQKSRKKVPVMKDISGWDSNLNLI